MTESRTHTGGKPLLKLSIVLLALLVTLLAVGILAAPRIVARVAENAIEDAASDHLGGSAEASVRVSWGGPMSVESLTVTDRDGQTVADLSVQTELSLLDALRFDGDAGKITIKDGTLTLTKAAAEALRAERGDGSGGGPGGPAEETDFGFLADLQGTLAVESLALTVVDERGEILSSETIDADATLDSGDATLSVRVPSLPLTIDADASGFVTSGGALDPRAGRAGFKFDAIAPRDTVERIARLFGVEIAGGTGGATIASASPGGDTAVARLHGTIENGRLTLLPTAGASSLPVPDALLAKLAGEGTAVTLGERPSVTIAVETFAADILPEGGGLLDLSTGILNATVKMTPISARVQAERDAPVENLESTPSTLTLSSPNLASRIETNFTTSVAVNGKRTGEISLKGSIFGPFSNDFGFRPESLESVTVLAEAEGIPPAMLEPLRGVLAPLYDGNPPTTAELFGQSISVVRFSIAPDRTLGYERASISARLESSNLLFRASLVGRDGEIVATDQDVIQIDTSNLAALVGPLLPETLSLAGTGRGAVSLLEPTIPLVDGYRPDLSRASAGVRILAGDTALVVNGQGDAPIDILSLDSTVEFAPGRPVQITADYRLAHLGEVFDLYATSTIDGFEFPSDVRTEPFDLSKIQARVLAKLTGVPVDAVDLFDPDTAALIRELGGELATIVVRPDESGDALAHTMDLSVDEGRFVGRSTLAMSDELFTVRDSKYTGTLTPDAFAFLLDSYATDAGLGVPELETAVPYTLTLAPINVGLGANRVPDPATFRKLSAHLTFDGDVVVREIERPGGDGERIAIGFRAGDSVRYHHDRIDRGDREINGTLHVFDPDGDPTNTLATISGNFGVAARRAEIDFAEANMPALDELLGLDGALAGATGPTASGRAQIVTDTYPPGTSYYLSASSDLLRARVHASDTAQGLSLAEPLTVSWNATASYLQDRLRLTDAATGENRLRIETVTPISIRFDELFLGPAGDRLRAESVKVNGAVGLDRFAFSIDGSAPVAYENIRASVVPTPALDALGFTLNAERPASWDAPAASRKGLEAQGTLSGLDTGEYSATLTVEGDVPTPIIDALARTDGAVHDLLGPTATLDVRANGLTQTSGDLLVNVLSARTQGSFQGEIDGSLLLVDDGARITITQISEDFSERYIESVLPFLTRFEKTASDKPASFVATGLTVPLGGELSTLNGSILMDLGTVQFKTSDLLGNVLERTNNRTQGELGGRIEPFTVTLANGVASYPRTPIPTGKYLMESRGVIDLVARKMDVILYLPLSAVSGDIRKAFEDIPGLDGLGQVPIRIKGSFEKPKVEAALDLVIKEGVPQAIDNVLDNVIKKGLDDLFKKK